MIAIEQRTEVFKLPVQPGYYYKNYPKAEDPQAELLFDTGEKAVYLGMDPVDEVDTYFIYDPKLIKVAKLPVSRQDEDAVNDLEDELSNPRVGYAVAPCNQDYIVVFKTVK